MLVHDETILAIAKNVVERGAPPVFSKAAYIQAIAKRSDEIKRPGESTHQSFVRAITADEVGKLRADDAVAKRGAATVTDIDQSLVQR